jgi:hypothetical protein
MEQVLKVALIREPVPIVWEEPEEAPPSRLNESVEDAVVTH